MNSTNMISSTEIRSYFIVGIIGIVFTFLLNIYQSIKSRHFHSECCGCELDYESEHQDK